MKITFPDGSVKEFPKGTTGLEIAKSIGERLAMAALAVEVNGKLQDLTRKIDSDAKIRIITFKDKEGVEVFRHSTAHLLANAIIELFPEAKVTIGPVVEEGFYYDIDHPPFTPSDLEKIEKRMGEIVAKKVPIERLELKKEEALKIFKNNPYKTEIVKQIDAKDTISAYKQGNFVDLCRGPHVPNTLYLKAFKLTKISSAYWKGDAKNKQLQRIYGISFPEKKQLDEYLKNVEEASKRDHRKLGKELELFMFDDLSPGSPFFLPKGTTLYNELLKFMREEYMKRGYKEVITPQIFNKKLWETSGHWEHFRENMFILNVDGEESALKPMNCPSHLVLFKNSTKSYRDLPLRIADFCMLHRNELKGVLGGLTRVRKFSQDDAHIFCTEDQIEEEVFMMLEFIKYVWERVFNFKLKYYLSTKPDKALGTEAMWKKAEKQLAGALEKAKIQYDLKPGDGAFYGPKIDIDIQDAFGRKWQCPTCQLDFNMPSRFNATYEAKDGTKKNPVMIHRAVYGSMERFIALLIEHYAGKFPLWLSPVQIKILPIADRHNEYANKIASMMKNKGIRVEVDTRTESTPKKVRDAQLEQVNYILVIGDKEQQNGTVNVRTRDNVVHGERKVDILVKELLDEIATKKI